jgi:uncharacterized membrane protein
MRDLSDREIQIDSTDLLGVALGLQALFLAVLLVEYVAVDTSFIRPVVTVLYLAFVPGGLTVLALRMECSLSSFVVYALGLSLSLVMAVGAVMSVTLIRVGIEHPLSVGSLAIVFALLVGGLAFLIYRDGQRRMFEIDSNPISPLPMALLLLPSASILGTVLLDVQGNNLLLLGLLIVLSIIPLGFAVRGDAERWGALAVWTMSMALLYHGGLWPFTGGHQLVQITLEQGHWVPNYADGMGSLVPNGVLYPIFAILTDLSMSVEWGTVNPFLMSFIPVVLFELFRQETSARTALLGTSLFMFSFPFYTLYPGGGRVATPVLFLALLGLAVVDNRVDSPLQNVLVMTFGAGVAVSHYGTAWVVMMGLIASMSVLYGLRIVDAVTSEQSTSTWLASLRKELQTSKVLSISAITFYTVFALSWYLFTGLGGKFKTLPNHVVKGAEALLYGDDLTGGAARSATKSYGSTAITTSRWLYILFGALMTLGVAMVLWRRVVDDGTIVTDEYLALGTGFLAILGAAFLPFSTGFNTARVMMIVFVFTAPFTLLGLAEIMKRIGPLIPTVREGASNLGSGTPLVAIASLLTVFLLLNSGVVSATVTSDYAPSNAVLQEQLLESDDPIERSKANSCTECIVDTHAWAFSRVGENRSMYGDDIATAQVDYVRGQITDQIGRVPVGARYQSLWTARNGTNRSAFLVVLPHNTDTGGVFVNQKYNWKAYDGLNKQFEESHRVYHGADSDIFLTSADNNSRNSTESERQLQERYSTDRTSPLRNSKS